MILFILSVGTILTVLAIIGILSLTSIVFLLFIFATRQPPVRKQSVTDAVSDAIRDGINETNVDFEIKHPRATFECPYRETGEGCIHMNTLTMKPEIECKDCEFTISYYK